MMRKQKRISDQLLNEFANGYWSYDTPVTRASPRVVTASLAFREPRGERKPTPLVNSGATPAAILAQNSMSV
jgi:hypothetical protein